MKKLFDVIMITLALNFLAAAGGAGWLFKSGHANKERLAEIKKILFPPAEQAPTTQPNATTQPSTALDLLLAKASGRTAGEQVEFIQQTFDAQTAQLDRRQRELNDLQRQVDLAKQQISHDRGQLEQEHKDLSTKQQEETKLATDKGFQDSLQLYSTMAPKQVKAIFLTLSDDTVQKYLEAMPPKTANKIIREYKGDEVERIQRVMERMRQSAPGAAPQPASAQLPTSP